MIFSLLFLGIWSNLQNSFHFESRKCFARTIAPSTAGWHNAVSPLFSRCVWPPELGWFRSHNGLFSCNRTTPSCNWLTTIMCESPCLKDDIKTHVRCVCCIQDQNLYLFLEVLDREDKHRAKKPSTMDCMLVYPTLAPPKILCWSLIHSVIVLGGEAFGRGLDLEEEAVNQKT